jgi:hypothetical protein
VPDYENSPTHTFKASYSPVVTRIFPLSVRVLPLVEMV